MKFVLHQNWKTVIVKLGNKKNYDLMRRHK
jgi:hypothetical protein